jgi:hypothetical protein
MVAVMDPRSQDMLLLPSMAPSLPRGETQAEFGRRVGVSQQRVAQLKKDGLPTLPNGRIDVGPALAWVGDHLDLERRVRGKAAAGGGDGEAGRLVGDASLTEARRQHELLKAERTRLRAKAEAGALISRAEAAAAAFEFNRLVRDAWLGWASRTAPVLAGEVGVSVEGLFGPLERLVREHLAELAALPVPEELHHG